MEYKLNLVIAKQGEGSNSGLSEAGKLQAEEICNNLIEKGSEFNKIYSSNSECAKQTIEPYLATKKKINLQYNKVLGDKYPSTLDKDLSETLATGIYKPEPCIDPFCIYFMWLDDDSPLNPLSSLEGYIERMDNFICKIMLNHLFYPENNYFKSQSVLIVTHSDNFKIVNSMIVPSKFSKIETTENVLNITFNFNWQEIIDRSYEHNPEYILYSTMYDYVLSVYLERYYESKEYEEVDDDPYDLESENLERYGVYYRNGRRIYFWD